MVRIFIVIALLFQPMAWGSVVKIIDIKPAAGGSADVTIQFDPSDVLSSGGVPAGSDTVAGLMFNYVYRDMGYIKETWAFSLPTTKNVSFNDYYGKSEVSWKRLAELFEAKNGRTLTVNVYSNTQSSGYKLKSITVCFGGGVNILSPIPLPNGCSNDKIPEIPNWCKVNGGSDLTFSHGTLSSDQANGHQVVKTVTISCNDPATIKLRMLTADIPMGGTVTSVVTANGNVIDTNGLLLPGGDKDKSVVLGSTLKVGSKGESGLFSGSGTLLVEIQ
jgi:hypothetical protein